MWVPSATLQCADLVNKQNQTCPDSQRAAPLSPESSAAAEGPVPATLLTPATASKIPFLPWTIGNKSCDHTKPEGRFENL